MQNKSSVFLRPRPSLLGVLSALGLLLSFAAQDAVAVEVGKPVTLSGIGQPLAMLVPLQLKPGERLVPDCVNIGLQVGGEWVPKHEIQRSVEINTETGAAVIRVNTQRPVAEPIVQISVGCPSKEVAALIDPVKLSSAPSTPLLDSRVPALNAAPALSKEPKDAKAAKPGKSASQAVDGHQGKSAERAPRWVMLPSIETDAPGLWRLDTAVGSARKGGQFEADTRWAQSSKATTLIMATDLSEVPAPAALAASAASAASAPSALQQSAAQLQSLEAQQRALDKELKALKQEVQEASAAENGFRWEWLLLAGALAMLVAMGGLIFRARHRKRLAAVA